MSRFWSCVLSTTFVLAATGILSAAELTVGPGKPFQRIEDALAKAQNGDTILVLPGADGAAYEKVAVYVAKSHITFKAAGERVALSGKDFDYSGRGSIPLRDLSVQPWRQRLRARRF